MNVVAEAWAFPVATTCVGTWLRVQIAVVWAILKRDGTRAKAEVKAILLGARVGWWFCSALLNVLAEATTKLKDHGLFVQIRLLLRRVSEEGQELLIGFNEDARFACWLPLADR